MSIDPSMLETDKMVAFPMLLRRVSISTLIPASNKIILNAKTLIRGANSLNKPLSIYPMPEPMRIPNPISQITSGILVNL